MIEERVGDWIKTFSGINFYPMDPRPEDIRIEDIAHALSNQCRFSGHVAVFHSVAQHSILVAKTVLTEGGSREEVLAGLYQALQTNRALIGLSSQATNLNAQFEWVNRQFDLLRTAPVEPGSDNSLARALQQLATEHPDVGLLYPVHLNPNVQEPVNRLLGGNPRIKATFVPDATPQTFLSGVKPVHLFHFAGHGNFEQ
jgi:hypothetical protein